MTSGQKSFPCVAPMLNSDNMGRAAGISVSLPNVASIADKISLIRSVSTEAIGDPDHLHQHRHAATRPPKYGRLVELRSWQPER